MYVCMYCIGACNCRVVFCVGGSDDRLILKVLVPSSGDYVTVVEEVLPMRPAGIMQNQGPIWSLLCLSFLLYMLIKGSHSFWTAV